MKEISNVEDVLSHLLVEEAVQIWAGCFNSLCREDYEEEEWRSIERKRRENNWEEPLTEVKVLIRSEPTTIVQVTARMSRLQFGDVWAVAGRHKPSSTNRLEKEQNLPYICIS